MDRTHETVGAAHRRQGAARARRCTRRPSGGAATPRAGRWCRACWRRCSSSSSWSAWRWCCATCSPARATRAATVSVVVKTLLLYTIMITGSIWEKEVFGRYLFAPAFFWEDVFSMLVLALHTAYLVALVTGCARRPRPDAAGAGRLRHLRHQRRRSSCSSCARRGATRSGRRPRPSGACAHERRVIRTAAAGGRGLRGRRRCCASAASARCSAA